MRELIVILLVVLLVFGAKKLRTIGSDLGSAVKGFKKAMDDGEHGHDDDPPRRIRSDEADAEFAESGKAKPAAKAASEEQHDNTRKSA